MYLLESAESYQMSQLDVVQNQKGTNPALAVFLKHASSAQQEAGDETGSRPVKHTSHLQNAPPGNHRAHVFMSTLSKGRCYRCYRKPENITAMKGFPVGYSLLWHKYRSLRAKCHQPGDGKNKQETSTET